MAFPAIMGRQLETPVINLGFSGSGRMEPAMAVLLARKQVKAWLFGHSHRWRTDKHEDLHLVNLPTMAYVFDKAQPAGWGDAQLRPDGMTLRPQRPRSPTPRSRQESRPGLAEVTRQATTPPARRPPSAGLEPGAAGPTKFGSQFRANP